MLRKYFIASNATVVYHKWKLYITGTDQIRAMKYEKIWSTCTVAVSEIKKKIHKIENESPFMKHTTLENNHSYSKPCLYSRDMVWW